MAHPLLSDPWVAAKIDAAVHKHGSRWTPAQIEQFREQMAWTLATHPRVALLLEVARPSVIDQSGPREVGGPIEVPAAGDGSAKDGSGQS